MTVRLGAAVLSVAFAAATLVGCGGSTSSDDGSAPSFASSKELAAAVGCKDYKEDGGQALASSGGGCDTADAGFVAINMFDDNDTRDRFMEIGIPNGGHYVYGDKWLIECTTEGDMMTIAAGIHGSSTKD
jgi:hypothetical protein